MEGRAGREGREGRARQQRLEHLSQGKRALEVGEEGSQLWLPAGTCILDVEKVCGAVGRCTEVCFWLLCEGCLGKRGGVGEGTGQVRTLSDRLIEL